MLKNTPYTEPPENSEFSRREYVSSLNSFVASLEEKSYSARDEFMPADSFFRNIESYRKKYIDMLGSPLSQYEKSVPPSSYSFVAEDTNCNIYRIKIEALPGLFFHGLYLVPHKETKPSPLVIAAHGALGTPELLCNMHGKNGYSNLVPRLISRGARVFAPQLLLWNIGQSSAKPRYETEYNRAELDLRLKSLGGSMTALEVFCIMRVLDFLEAHPQSAFSHVGFAGMSYGAYIGLHMMAADTRIESAYLSGCFNDRLRYRFSEWHYNNAANTFLDAEIAALCAPRALYLEVGRKDDIFDFRSAEREAHRAEKYYAAAGAEKKLCFSVWDGGHLVNPADDGLEFLFENMA